MTMLDDIKLPENHAFDAERIARQLMKYRSMGSFYIDSKDLNIILGIAYVGLSNDVMLIKK